VLGATGSVGQRFISLLSRHPWFEIAALTASERSAGKPYGEAVSWLQEEPLPPEIAAMEVLPTAPPLPCRMLFSALDSTAAQEAEPLLARAGHFVVSNAKSHRMGADIPLVVPEINPGHLALLDHQSFGEGALVTNPNCSTIGLVLALKPLFDAFGIRRAHVVTLQALSGAGVPGVPSLAALDNVVPFIGGEEDKVENEPRKILGRFAEGAIEPAEMTISAQCNRVAVIDGHLECVSLELGRRASLEEVEAALEGFRGLPQELGLPSAPEHPVLLTREPDRPQPRLDRGRGAGMSATVGRLRPCPLFDYKFVVLSHNTLRGAAGGALLVAELALAMGRVPGLTVPEPVAVAG
jgi:aspartate-semialdehyde dehydrogenase